MNESLWHQELLFAANDEDVLDTVHDYLVLWRPDELAWLPVPCNPARFVDVRAVSEYAAELLAQELPHSRRSTACESLMAFFAVAAHRIAELAASATAKPARRPEAVRI